MKVLRQCIHQVILRLLREIDRVVTGQTDNFDKRIGGAFTIKENKIG